MACPHLNFAMDWFNDELWDRLLHNVGARARGTVRCAEAIR